VVHRWQFLLRSESALDFLVANTVWKTFYG
jgi:hypothetical protein